MPAKLYIVSGGQTGADRGGLNAALSRGVACGGYCTHDMMAEDGLVDAKYGLIPRPVIEDKREALRDRTSINVQDSNGTIVFVGDYMSPGSGFTLSQAKKYNKPALVVLLAEHSPGYHAYTVGGFLVSLLSSLPPKERVCRVNIAGSRESMYPGIQAQVEDIVGRALDLVLPHCFQLDIM